MTDPTYNPGNQGISTEAAQMLNSFWPDVSTKIRGLNQVCLSFRKKPNKVYKTKIMVPLFSSPES